MEIGILISLLDPGIASAFLWSSSVVTFRKIALFSLPFLSCEILSLRREGFYGGRLVFCIEK